MGADVRLFNSQANHVVSSVADMGNSGPGAFACSRFAGWLASFGGVSGTCRRVCGEGGGEHSLLDP